MTLSLLIERVLRYCAKSGSLSIAHRWEIEEIFLVARGPQMHSWQLWGVSRNRLLPAGLITPHVGRAGPMREQHQLFFDPVFHVPRAQ